MNNKEKKAIKTKLASFVKIRGSQVKAAKAIGVSSATVNQLLNDNWELISDQMWRHIAAQINFVKSPYVIAETRGYRRMYSLLQESQSTPLVIAVVGSAGCGKTAAIKSYCEQNKNAYHLCCSEYWNRKQFLVELLQCMGESYIGLTVANMVDDIVKVLKKKNRPLIVLDECDKLSDQVLYFFITLYNKLEDHAGIVLCSTDYFRRRIEFGVRVARKGYQEIYSRIGRRFIPIQMPSAGDINAICVANDVNDEQEIQTIIEKAERDLRSVKVQIHVSQRKGQQRKE
jgi:DNA transposition AAA+ family ATPase